MDRDAEVNAILERVGYPGTDAKQLDRFVCKSGVVLKTRKVKLSIIRDAWKQLHRPQVPTTFIEELGRWEENPNDPNFLEELQEYNITKSNITINVLLMMGTQPHFIPDGVPAVDSDWTAEFAEAGLNIPETPKAKYVAWLRYIVLEDHEEENELQQNVMRMSGIVQEKDAQEAESSFPGN